jgi:hypothetical protein
MEKIRRARRLFDLGEDDDVNDNNNANGGCKREKEGTECQSDNDREEDQRDGCNVEGQGKGNGWKAGFEVAASASIASKRRRLKKAATGRNANGNADNNKEEWKEDDEHDSDDDLMTAAPALACLPFCLILLRDAAVLFDEGHQRQLSSGQVRSQLHETRPTWEVGSCYGEGQQDTVGNTATQQRQALPVASQ